MKNYTVPSHGRSGTFDNNRPSGNVDGSCKSGIPTGQQEESAGGFGSSREICERSERDRVWEEIEYLLSNLGRHKEMLVDGTDWDPEEVKWINERYRLCRQQALEYVLCLNISTVLTTVSFPGERLSYLEVAKRVIIDCSERELAEAIWALGLNPYHRVYFKAEADKVPVERAEEILLRMLGDGEYVLASEFLEELELSAKSASYTVLKESLTEKGWKWKSKKVNRKVIKVIER